MDLNTYLDEIGRESLLTADEERRLSSRILRGDTRALNRLVEANLRLVVAIASEYQGQGLAIDDLVSEGNIGLMKAARKYDATRSLRFAGYASPHIRRQVEKALKAESTERRVERGAAGQTRSVDAPLGAKSNMSLLAVLADGNAPSADGRMYSAAAEQAVEHALTALKGREREVVTAYFGIGRDNLTMAEIALDMGLRRERVRQIRDRAIRRMKSVWRKQLAELRG